MTKLYSFDIFDTCLIRTCGKACAVYAILAEEILGDKAEESAKIDFALIRRNAEREARQMLINEDNEEVTLEDIYNYCDFSSITDIDKSIIMNAEMDIEERVLLPVEKIKEEINDLIKKGAKVIYISDMYLPKAFLEKILKKNGFYVNQNIFVSSDIKKTKSSGHLYDFIASKFHISKKQWLHIGDNIISDYKVPQKRHIKTKPVNHNYNLYEIGGNNLMTNGTIPNNGFIFTLSRAIRLSFPNTSNHIFASTFIAPMCVPFVYKVLCDSQRKGINHLFFVARDGYILYQIALEMRKQFPTIELSYLYASRQALYMAGIEELTSESIKRNMPHLMQKGIDNILYELHLSSFDYSNLELSGLNGEQIIDTLFKDKVFVDALKKKHHEQSKYIIDYFKQEGLTSGNNAIVDVVGSRRCQKAINNILVRNKYSKIFSFYFEVTWSRITEYEPYLAMSYQENVINTQNYHHASQALYEQFFVITNQKRTIEYQINRNRIVPVYEDDFLNESYKQKVFEINLAVCIKYAKHYIMSFYNKNPNFEIQTAQKVFAYFCHVPHKQFLKALESFRCTGSGEANEVMLNKKNLLYVILHRSQFFRWPEGQLIYSSGWLYPLIRWLLYLRYIKKGRIFHL